MDYLDIEFRALFDALVDNLDTTLDFSLEINDLLLQAFFNYYPYLFEKFQYTLTEEELQSQHILLIIQLSPLVENKLAAISPRHVLSDTISARIISQLLKYRSEQSNNQTNEFSHKSGSTLDFPDKPTLLRQISDHEEFNEFLPDHPDEAIDLFVNGMITKYYLHMQPALISRATTIYPLYLSITQAIELYHTTNWSTYNTDRITTVVSKYIIDRYQYYNDYLMP